MAAGALICFGTIALTVFGTVRSRYQHAIGYRSNSTCGHHFLSIFEIQQHDPTPLLLRPLSRWLQINLARTRPVKVDGKRSRWRPTGELTSLLCCPNQQGEILECLKCRV